LASVKPKCRGCDGRHIVHAGPCKALAAQRGATIALEGGGVARVCGYRPPCPCAWRDCSCGATVAIAALLPDDAVAVPDGEVVLVPFLRGTAGPDDPAGRLAVRRVADGYLACRELADGDQLRPGEVRRTEHDDERAGHKITYTRRERAEQPA
jgi:hypothetical protein